MTRVERLFAHAVVKLQLEGIKRALVLIIRAEVQLAESSTDGIEYDRRDQRVTRYRQAMSLVDSIEDVLTEVEEHAKAD